MADIGGTHATMLAGTALLALAAAARAQPEPTTGGFLPVTAQPGGFDPMAAWQGILPDFDGSAFTAPLERAQEVAAGFMPAGMGGGMGAVLDGPSPLERAQEVASGLVSGAESAAETARENMQQFTAQYENATQGAMARFGAAVPADTWFQMPTLDGLDVPAFDFGSGFGGLRAAIDGALDGGMGVSMPAAGGLFGGLPTFDGFPTVPGLAAGAFPGFGGLGGMMPSGVAAAFGVAEEGDNCEVYRPTGGVSAWSPTASSIRVRDEFQLEDVKVKVNVKSKRVGALKIALVAQSRRGEEDVVLLKKKGQGGSGDDLVDVVFADGTNATFPVDKAAAPFTGTYAPAKGAMKKFLKGSGLKAAKGGSAGTWSLVIEDVGPNPERRANKTEIVDWELHLCHNGEPVVSASPGTPVAARGDDDFAGVPEPTVGCPAGELGCPRMDLSRFFDAQDAEAGEDVDVDVAQAFQVEEEGEVSAGVSAYRAFKDTQEANRAALDEVLAGFPSLGKSLEGVPDAFWAAFSMFQYLSWAKDATLPRARNVPKPDLLKPLHMFGPRRHEGPHRFQLKIPKLPQLSLPKWG